MLYPNVTILTGVSPATLQTWLASAQAAYAALAGGGRYASVSYDGKSVTYASTDIAMLSNWIMLLQQQLGIPGAGRRRALRPIYY